MSFHSLLPLVLIAIAFLCTVNARSHPDRAQTLPTIDFIRRKGSHHNLSKRANAAKAADTLKAEPGEWTTEVAIGTPPVNFEVQIDTGSSDLWVGGSGCTTCTGAVKFSSTKSSTAKDQQQVFALSYADGTTIQGDVFTDTVSVAGLNVPKQAFGSAATDSSAGSTPGILGLGNVADSQIASTLGEAAGSSFFTNLAAQNPNIFNGYGVALTNTGGTLCLGCYDSGSMAADLHWIPASDKSALVLTIPMTGIAVGGKAVTGTAATAYVDTGTTGIGIPTTVATAIYSKFGGAVCPEASSGTISAYTYPCDATPNVSFDFGDCSITIPNDVFNLQGEQACGGCLGGILGLPDATFSGANGIPWLLGDTFLLASYVVFNNANNSVGIAPLAS